MDGINEDNGKTQQTCKTKVKHKKFEIYEHIDVACALRIKETTTRNNTA